MSRGKFCNAIQRLTEEAKVRVLSLTNKIKGKQKTKKMISFTRNIQEHTN